MFDNEICYVLIGKKSDNFWVAKKLYQGSGTPVSVNFDAEYVLNHEEKKGNVLGFYHTHPGMIAYPSGRDFRTMNAWTNCFGKPLVCLIEGIDGLKGYWFIDDEQPIKVCRVEEMGTLFIGDQGGSEQISSRRDLSWQESVGNLEEGESDDLRGGGVGEQPGGNFSETRVSELQSD
jgi:hypothetical protein